MGRATTLIQRVTASHVEFRRMLMTVQIVGRVYAIAAPSLPPRVLHMRVSAISPCPSPFPNLYRRRCVNNPNLGWDPGGKKGKERILLLASSSLVSRPRSLPFALPFARRPRWISIWSNSWNSKGYK